MRKLLIAVVVLVGLLVAGDFVARAIAENRLASAVDDHQGVSGSSVDIHGFPFLTQVLDREFGEIEVDFPALTASTRVGALQAEDVTLIFRDVRTTDSFTSGVARRVDGSGTVPYDAFEAIGPVEVSYGGGSEDGTGYVLLTMPGVGAEVRLQPSVAEGRTLRLDGAVLDRLPPAVGRLVQSQIQLEGLPDQVSVESLRATEAGIEVALAADEVPLNR